MPFDRRPKRRPAAPKPQRDRTTPAPKHPAAPQRMVHVLGLDRLLDAASAAAEFVENEVFEHRKRADRALSEHLKRARLSPPDQRFVSQAVFALVRWRGWTLPLHADGLEARLLWSWLLDQTEIHPACRELARRVNVQPGSLVALGDAPDWPVMAQGLRRMIGRPIATDPWRLFPDWFREHVSSAPGEGTPKHRQVALLRILQTPAPFWVRDQSPTEGATWSELRAEGVKPWVHRRLTRAAKLDSSVDIHHFSSYERGMLEIQDLASQAVGHVCDPDPGERWWDVCAGAGGKALHLASLMRGRGVVIATDSHAGRLKEAARRARRSPLRNISVKPSGGDRAAGKPGSFHGVLVDAPCSALGTWRRNPDARWLIDGDAVERLAAQQRDLLTRAARGVRKGGSLVYSVCTWTEAETSGVVQAFLEANPTFQLDPFPHPFTGTETAGTLQIWPREADSDAMYIARMVRG